jgi:hypothetical protein
MPVDTLTLLLVALCGGGLCFAFWYFSEAQRVKRALAAAPITAIAQLREGDTVRVVGALKLGPRTLSSPLSGRPCAVFFVRVREQVGKNSREIFRVSEAVEFSIDDGSGTVLVRPELFSLALVEDHQERTGLWRDASAEVGEYMLSKGQSAQTSLGFNRALQFHEAVLEAGERVAVLATVRLELDPEPVTAGDGYRDQPRRKVLLAPPGGLMLLSDAPETTT